MKHNYSQNQRLQKGDYLYKGYRITQFSNPNTSIKVWKTSKYRYASLCKANLREEETFSVGDLTEYEHISYTLKDAKAMIDNHCQTVGHLMSNAQLQEFWDKEARDHLPS